MWIVDIHMNLISVNGLWPSLARVCLEWDDTLATQLALLPMTLHLVCKVWLGARR